MKRRHDERGFSLMIAVSVTVLLSMMGLMIMQQAASDVQSAGGERAAVNLQTAADMGSTWAPLALTTLLYPGGYTAGAVADASLVPTKLRPLDPTLYPLFCPENYCAAPPCAQLVDCSKFYALASQNYSAQSAQRPGAQPNLQVSMVLSCSPACVTGQAVTFTVRSLAQSAAGSTQGRLIEMELAAN